SRPGNRMLAGRLFCLNAPRIAKRHLNIGRRASPTRRSYLKAAAAVSTVCAAPAFLPGRDLNSPLNLAATSTGSRRPGDSGPVSEVHVWVSRAWGRQSAADAKKHGDIVYVEERPTDTHEIPANLDWDLWLGPAPARPFNNVYFPGPKWYRWWDFGNGTMSDL